MTTDADFAAAQALFEQARYVSALDAARALTEQPAADDDAQLVEALRLRCLAAFRLGELDEAARSAQRLVDRSDTGDQSRSLRIDVLAVSVLAAGELARYDQSIAHVQLMQSAAAHAGTWADYVRARGTVATCFALLGDPWAAQRLLSELAGHFQGGSPELRLEATVRNNHASVCLMIARLARQGSDDAACDEALEHAAASIERSREIAAAAADGRGQAFSNVHAAELALLRGDTAKALTLLDGAIAHADAAELWAHSRQLRLLEAEALMTQGDAAGALAHLDRVAQRLDEGHELGARIRYHAQMQRVRGAQGDIAAALSHIEQACTLAQYRQYRQALAQSRHLRTRLELEHLHRFRGAGGASARSTTPTVTK